MRTFRLLLIITGCITLFMGVAVIAVASSSLLTTPVSTHDTPAVYVSGEGCVTCHTGASAADLAPTPHLLHIAVVNPHLATSDAAAPFARPAADPPTAVIWAAVTPAPDRQRYILHTANGAVALANDWTVAHRWCAFAPNSLKRPATPAALRYSTLVEEPIR